MLAALSVISLGCGGAADSGNADGPDPSGASASPASTTLRPPVAPTTLPARGLGMAVPPVTLVPATSTTSEAADPFRRPGDLLVGDCFDIEGWPDPDLIDLDEILAIECGEPHTAEVFARVSLNDDPDAAHPGDEHVAAAADGVCFEHFEGYVGVRYVDTRLEIIHLRPPMAAWVRGDRTVACMVVNANFEPLVGSVAAEQ